MSFSSCHGHGSKRFYLLWFCWRLMSFFVCVWFPCISLVNRPADVHQNNLKSSSTFTASRCVVSSKWIACAWDTELSSPVNHWTQAFLFWGDESVVKSRTWCLGSALISSTAHAEQSSAPLSLPLFLFTLAHKSLKSSAFFWDTCDGTGHTIRWKPNHSHSS